MKLKRYQLSYVIRESVIRRRDFSTCLLESLLLEADWSKLAGRSEKQGNSIITHSSGGEDYVIDYVITVGPYKDGKFPEIQSASIGSKDDQVKGKWWRLTYLYSNSPSSVPLTLVASLSFHRKVLADTSVSPAAESVIKGYYEKESSNPKLIQDDADTVRIENGQDEKSPWLRAGYFAPPGTDAVAWRARLAGDDIVEDISTKTGMSEDEVRQKFAEAAEQGFSEAYADEKRTGIQDVPEEIEGKLKSAFSSKNIGQIATILYQGSQQQKSGKKLWPTPWITKNYNKLVELLIHSFKKPNLTKPEKSSINYLDDLVHALFSNEGRNDVYILEDALDRFEQTSPEMAKKIRAELS